jgi:hypothetical protein
MHLINSYQNFPDNYPSILLCNLYIFLYVIREGPILAVLENQVIVPLVLVNSLQGDKMITSSQLSYCFNFLKYLTIHLLCLFSIRFDSVFFHNIML